MREKIGRYDQNIYFDKVRQEVLLKEYRMYPISIFNDDFFDSIFKDFMPTLNNHSFSFDDAFPPINLYMNSNDKACIFELALTGYKKDWLSVEITGTTMTITADVPEEAEDDTKKYFKRRIQAKSFKKYYKIPEGYDTDNAEVTYEDGLLTVVIPVKVKPQDAVKKLTIK